MTAEDRRRVLAAVERGVRDVHDFALVAAPDASTPCGTWRVHDLVRHLETVASMYVLWVGAALGGRTSRLRVGAELLAHNALMLERLPEHPTVEHAARHRDLALDHVRLSERGWDHPMLATPGDRLLTVGEHAGVAAVEWQVHAWDLATAAGIPHIPDEDDLRVLTVAWDDVLAQTTGTIRETSGDRWTSLLVATGRTP